MKTRISLVALLILLPISAMAQEDATLEKVAKLALAVGEDVEMIPQLMKYWKIHVDTDELYG